ncbi:hypothetical protein B0H63DRAFT_490508 [Podospora didyma]|uniref:Uncharacterized protein n=1 Tax=Podospora didyma TaxID=330526 RepID=A0AAE0JYU1_9PEZI|nr:hypothetical protein B0H63DRAFT_490508 [Podospora didyma]
MFFGILKAETSSLCHLLGLGLGTVVCALPPSWITSAWPWRRKKTRVIDFRYKKHLENKACAVDSYINYQVLIPALRRFSERR